MTVLNVIHLPTGGIVGAVTRVGASAVQPSAADLVGRRLPVRGLGTEDGELVEIALDAALLAVAEVDPAEMNPAEVDPSKVDLESFFHDPTLFSVVRDAPGGPTKIAPGPSLTVQSVTLSSTAMTVTVSAQAPRDLSVFAWLSQTLGAPPPPPVVTAVGVLKRTTTTVEVGVSLTPGEWVGAAFVAGLAPFRTKTTIGGEIVSDPSDPIL